MTKEQEIEFIAGRIVDEHRKHPTLEWHKIAASKIRDQWKEYWVAEKEKRIAELEKSYKQLQDAYNSEVAKKEEFKSKWMESDKPKDI